MTLLPDDVKELTFALSSGTKYNRAMPLYSSAAASASGAMFAVVTVMKHWKFPEEIWKALESIHPALRFQFSGSPGTLLCKVYVIPCLHVNDGGMYVNDGGIAAMNQLFLFFNRRTAGFAEEFGILVKLWKDCFNTTGISMQKMPLPDFQQILKGVEKQCAAGPMLGAGESDSLAGGVLRTRTRPTLNRRPEFARLRVCVSIHPSP